jgi:hypothetical protein
LSDLQLGLNGWLGQYSAIFRQRDKCVKLNGVRQDRFESMRAKAYVSMSFAKTAKTGSNGEKRAENGSENRPKTAKNRGGCRQASDVPVGLARRE